ncbi:MAG: hypothetical protein CME63_03375 [Halobacteriovoraceae bacterium]|nr:hypothetical protein [Halobacteriovoraceae bacterium]MBC96762.1 hypothetical protein [Halobacteriovoraceae bacterium]|tara:strand:+ start:55005 stop:55544 length:540 start_codon:yes stop_codon:yes gene_type:complete
MTLWKNFLNEIKSHVENLGGVTMQKFTSRLHEKVSQLLPEKTEEEHVRIACLSGLMARIAYNDLKIDAKEKEVIQNSLVKWAGLTKENALAVAELCLSEVKDLAGIENHLYCLPLRESLSLDERYNIIVSLFAVAAADGKVENGESEEIRNINHGLLLEHKHFIAARSTVLESLGVLNQ